MSLDPIDIPRLEALLAARNDSEQAYNLYLVTMLRAAPALLAELKELREKVQMTVGYNTALRSERDRLRAELADRDDEIARLKGYNEGLIRDHSEVAQQLTAANDANAGLREEVSWAMKYFETCGQLGAAERLRSAGGEGVMLIPYLIALVAVVLAAYQKGRSDAFVKDMEPILRRLLDSLEVKP